VDRWNGKVESYFTVEINSTSGKARIIRSTRLRAANRYGIPSDKISFLIWPPFRHKAAN
jgi:hypothetical protein